MAGLGWLVLTLVFVDEVLAAVAAGVAGHAALGLPGAVGAPLVVILAWGAFASPRAPYGGPVVRPLVKVLVFGSAAAGLWLASHPDWALALAAFSAVVNGLAQLRFVREVDPRPIRRWRRGSGS